MNMTGIEKQGQPDFKFQFNQGTGDKTFQGEEGKSFRTEREQDFDLNWDLTKHRAYDYQLGRFHQVDPLADQGGQESLTSYQYSFNNPVRYNDPFGDCPTCPPVNGEGIVRSFNSAVSSIGNDLKSIKNEIASFFGLDGGVSFEKGNEPTLRVGSNSERSVGIVITGKGDPNVIETDKASNVIEVNNEDLQVARQALNMGEFGSKNTKLTGSPDSKAVEGATSTLAAGTDALTYEADIVRFDTINAAGGKSSRKIVTKTVIRDGKVIKKDTTAAQQIPGGVFWEFDN